MAEPLFSASRVKLRRAAQFISELEGELNRYRQSDPLKARFDPTNPPGILVEWAGITELPGAIIGDAIHNMRTALDLMASELTSLAQKSNRNVYFPFSETEDTLNDRIKDKNFHKAGDDAVALLKTFAPYKAGNEYLRALHDLDVHDKHRALVVTGHTMNIEFAASYNIDDLTQNDVAILKCDIHYIFPQDGPLAGKIVIQTLKELVELVNGILEAFARLVELRNTPKI